MTRAGSLRRIRLADVCVIVALAPIWAPILAVCAAAVLVGGGGPILFRQNRAGLHGTPFTMLKLRSMRPGPNPLVPDPDAVTRVGRFLRRYSLDELPQLVNVLRGEMSLVGPRPMLPGQTRRLDSDGRTRHLVRPGLTGLAQINGRNGLRWEERLHFDRAWAAQPTLGRYIGILFATAGVVLSGRGVDGHQPDDRFVDLTDRVREHHGDGVQERAV